MSKAMAWSWVRVSCLVLLFSGCLAAAVNKDIPEAAAAARGEPATEWEITLTKFTWDDHNDDPVGYTSMAVCYIDSSKNGKLGGDAVYTLLYKDEANDVLKVFDFGIPEEDDCVRFSKTDVVIDVPEGSVTYELHITTKSDEEKLGVATFKVVAEDYEDKGPVVECGESSSYTRAVVENDVDCGTGAGSVLITDSKICYTPTTSGLPAPNKHGCMANPDATPPGLEVCLSDKIPTSTATLDDGTVTVDSLTYPAVETDPVELAATYEEGVTSATAYEVLLQVAGGSEPFHVGSCGDGTPPCAIDGYPQAVETYEVCVVGVIADEKVVYTDPGVITDLNLDVFDNGKQLEFGFKNANPGDDANPGGKIYYASVVTDDGQETPVDAVAIDCTGVDPEHTCYGFLTVPDAGPYNVKVGYGTKTGETIDSDFGSNIIIAPHTKKTQEPQE